MVNIDATNTLKILTAVQIKMLDKCVANENERQ